MKFQNCKLIELISIRSSRGRESRKIRDFLRSSRYAKETSKIFFRLFILLEKEKSHEELKDLQNKLESALSALADEQERASASFTLLENMKLKMGTMVEEVSS